MARYYVSKNAQSNGDHEVHKFSCSRLPKQQNRIFVGNHSSCRPAVRRARRKYSQVNGCYYCSNSCHTS
jgi:hypothetical protein